MTMGCKREQGDNKGTDQYREKRMKNNYAVKKSRDKTKQKAQEASDRVRQLEVDNQNLKITIDTMTQELEYLKKVLFSNANGKNFENCPQLEDSIQQILNEEGHSDPDHVKNIVEEFLRANPQ